MWRVRLAWWLWTVAYRLAPTVVIRPQPLGVARDLPARASQLVGAAERLDAGGEYKRHVVLAQLQKEFPGRRVRVLVRAIEEALP